MGKKISGWLGLTAILFGLSAGTTAKGSFPPGGFDRGNIYIDFAEKATGWLMAVAAKQSGGAFSWPTAEENPYSRGDMIQGAAGIGLFFLNLGRIHPSPHPQNQLPLLSPIGLKKVKANEKLEFPVSAVDPEGDPLIFVCAQLPQGASFERRVFSWTPSGNQAGTYKVYFIATDRHSWVWEEVEIEVVKAKGTPGRR